MRISFDDMKKEFNRVLIKYGFPEAKAEVCADIFARNSLDGVYSHGLNRFPVFIQHVKERLVNPAAEPETIGINGTIEQWDGHLGPGMYIATLAMRRAVVLSKQNGIGGVAVRNTNHWMRG